MRTARSWTSGENFGDFLMWAPFSIEGASSKFGAVHSLTVFLDAIKEWGFAGPAVISLALLNVEGYELRLGELFDDYARGAADRQALVLPERWVDDLGAFAPDDILRPMMDMLWQAFDAPRCDELDEVTG
jgi:hypothetical protein